MLGIWITLLAVNTFGMFFASGLAALAGPGSAAAAMIEVAGLTSILAEPVLVFLVWHEWRLLVPNLKQLSRDRKKVPTLRSRSGTLNVDNGLKNDLYWRHHRDGLASEPLRPILNIQQNFTKGNQGTHPGTDYGAVAVLPAASPPTLIPIDPTTWYWLEERLYINSDGSSYRELV